jgi:hypothetical protein
MDRHPHGEVSLEIACKTHVTERFKFYLNPLKQRFVNVSWTMRNLVDFLQRTTRILSEIKNFESNEIEVETFKTKII